MAAIGEEEYIQKLSHSLSFHNNNIYNNKDKIGCLKLFEGR